MSTRKLSVFNNVSLDGYFVSTEGAMDWAYQPQGDAEWDQFVAGNASGGGALLFGRITYQMMASYWPSPMARQSAPEVADGMNRMPKYVVSRTLDKAGWQNTTLLKGDLVSEIEQLKNSPGPDVTILGSGSVVAQLAPHGLIDAYQLVVNPVILGGGRTMFQGGPGLIKLRLSGSRGFRNGKVVLSYSAR